MNLPNDPIMLMSVINTRLRDEYSSFEKLCKSLNIDKYEIMKKLEKAGFKYKPDINQFR
ncbi:MAG: DUF4250 domain-containing protein [Ruminococcus sp.]|nr:DUF4250 domain-containing protein [Ruminococcus sp.]